MDVALHSTYIESEHFFLDSNLRTKFLFFGLFAWWPKMASIYGYNISDNCMHESNVSASLSLGIITLCLSIFALC
ncbi:hypothetical protein JOM56_005094 [Amanita muscaria]